MKHIILNHVEKCLKVIKFGRRVVIKNQKLNGIYQEIAEKLGYEVAEEIYKDYGGLQIAFPNKFEDPNSLHETIFEEYVKGENVQKLAKKYGYSERYLRKVLNKYRK